jgi:hypothetical protein
LYHSLLHDALMRSMSTAGSNSQHPTPPDAVRGTMCRTQRAGARRAGISMGSVDISAKLALCLLLRQGAVLVGNGSSRPCNRV